MQASPHEFSILAKIFLWNFVSEFFYWKICKGIFVIFWPKAMIVVRSVPSWLFSRVVVRVAFPLMVRLWLVDSSSKSVVSKNLSAKANFLLMPKINRFNIVPLHITIVFLVIRPPSISISQKSIGVSNQKNQKLP